MIPYRVDLLDVSVEGSHKNTNLLPHPLELRLIAEVLELQLLRALARLALQLCLRLVLAPRLLLVDQIPYDGDGATADQPDGRDPIRRGEGRRSIAVVAHADGPCLAFCCRRPPAARPCSTVFASGILELLDCGLAPSLLEPSGSLAVWGGSSPARL
jgi:hypothetical protein